MGLQISGDFPSGDFQSGDFHTIQSVVFITCTAILSRACKRCFCSTHQNSPLKGVAHRKLP